MLPVTKLNKDNQGSRNRGVKWPVPRKFTWGSNMVFWPYNDFWKYFLVHRSVDSQQNHYNRGHQLSYFKAKMHQIGFRLGLLPDPLRELTALRRPPAGFKGAASKCGAHDFDPHTKYSSRAPEDNRLLFTTLYYLLTSTVVVWKNG